MFNNLTDRNFRKSKPSLIAIVGPTASGKTDLGYDIARSIGGEIICCDSMTIYKDLNIGTAKPTIEYQKKVKHWGLDLVTIEEGFNVYKFKNFVDQKIIEIKKRNKIPILVGGSGLYIEAVLYDYQFKNKPDSNYKTILNKLSVTKLQKYFQLKNVGIEQDSKNKRHLVNKSEMHNLKSNTDTELYPGALMIGLLIDRHDLKSRIQMRYEKMLREGFIDEVKYLSSKYNTKEIFRKNKNYQIVKELIDSKINANLAKELIVKNDLSLAKKQMTWFKRDRNIMWTTKDQAIDYINLLFAS